MHSTITRQVSKMDVQIGKKHRELAQLYEQRAKLMQKGFVKQSTYSISDIDFSDSIMDELAKEIETKPRAKKTK